jgi:hypothetical protein
VKGEKVEIGFAQPAVADMTGTTSGSAKAYESKTVTCTFTTDGSIDMSFPSGICTPVV